MSLSLVLTAFLSWLNCNLHRELNIGNLEGKDDV